MKLISDSMTYFFGVVENNNDPLMQGRVQVRVIGVHPFKRTQDDIDGLATEDLPWMNILMPVTSATVSGIGTSPVGLLNGSHVFGLWLDKYKTNGIIQGSLAGYFSEKPNSDEGFSDPTGTYPTQAGSTTSNLGIGGTTGSSDNSNVNQDGQTVVGINPTGSASGSTPSSVYNESLSAKMIAQEEGRRNLIYEDRSGWSIGIGHLCIQSGTKIQAIKNLDKQLNRSTGGVITSTEIDMLFKKDLDNVRSGIQKHSVLSSVYNSLNGSRRMALENMAFQMGVGGLAKFTTSLGLMKAGKWDEAAKNLLNSLWARQTAGRAARVAGIIKYGNLSPYSISDSVAPKTTVKSSLVESKINVTTMLSSFNMFSFFDEDNSVSYVSDEDIPSMPKYEQPKKLVDENGVLNGVTDSFWAEEKPELGDLLFQQPPSSYAGKYPHVKVNTTTSGHITEVDDTPGNERTRTVHPTGTYVEVNPLGMHITKSMSDMYNISEGDMNNYCSGALKTNISGDEIFYNLGNKKLQVNGDQQDNIDGSFISNILENRTLYVKGNDVKTIDGDGTVVLKGNLKIIVEGDADIQVNGNLKSVVQGNSDQTVLGNVVQVVQGNMNSNINGQYVVNASSINLISKGAIGLKGTRVDLDL